MTMDPLETMVREQRRWSLTANQLKKTINTSRFTVLVLAIIGAVFETLGAQIHLSQPDNALRLGYLGAASLAIIAVIRQWQLGRDRLQAWIVARAASESLKREIYLFRTAAGVYVTDNRAVMLFERRNEILGKVRLILRYVVEPKETTAAPGPLDSEGYIKERVDAQTAWFRARAKQSGKIQSLFDRAQFALAILAALLGAALTMTGKQAYGAWVAVITTIIGVLGAHVLSQRYDQLTISYRAAADRLDGIIGQWRVTNSSPSQLVEKCEAVLLEENQGWIAGADEAFTVGTPANGATEHKTGGS
jgi:hypothetical protein